MATLDKFKVDPEKANAGKWFTFADDIEFKIASIRNPEYEAYIRKLSKPHSRQFKQGVGTEALEKEIAIKALARYVLVDWRNIEELDADGNLVELSYSENDAIRILNEFPDIFDFVVDVARATSSFSIEADRTSEGN